MCKDFKRTARPRMSISSILKAKQAFDDNKPLLTSSNKEENVIWLFSFILELYVSPNYLGFSLWSWLFFCVHINKKATVRKGKVTVHKLPLLKSKCITYSLAGHSENWTKYCKVTFFHMYLFNPLTVNLISCSHVLHWSIMKSQIPDGFGLLRLYEEFDLDTWKM